ncbi:MAG: FtsX-like permease family protein [Nitrosomonas sp.]|nr:FtsX-like permease family protein [Nitrosomonas sp.]
MLQVLTLAVAGVAAVSQRTAEIGLLKAIGATSGDIRRLFFAEVVWLSLTGAVFGFLLGQSGSLLLRLTFPQLPAWVPAWASIAGILVTLATGVLASLFPANRAARLDAMKALGSSPSDRSISPLKIVSDCFSKRIQAS